MGFLLSFSSAVREAERRLVRVFPEASIEVHGGLDSRLLGVVQAMDQAKFREALRYTAEEIAGHAAMAGFVLILARDHGEPLGMAYGYDHQEGGFFLDDLASMMEGRGVGRLLAALIVVYAHERGHGSVTLFTEEEDEKGRHLRRFYERMGFRYMRTTPGEGDVMVLDLEPGTAEALVARYIVEGKGIP